MRRSLETINLEIKKALDVGSIYNVEYQDLRKELSRLIERKASQYDIETVAAHAKLPYYQFFISDIQSLKSALKKSSWEQFHQDWAEIIGIITDLETLKPTIIAGRKSAKLKVFSDKPIGTCGICGKQMCLQGDNIWVHGFQVHYHSYRHVGGGIRHGQNCFGSGSLPIEVSSEVLVRYIQFLDEVIARKPKPEDLEALIESKQWAEHKLKIWAPAPLPQPN